MIFHQSLYPRHLSIIEMHAIYDIFVTHHIRGTSCRNKIIYDIFLLTFQRAFVYL